MSSGPRRDLFFFVSARIRTCTPASETRTSSPPRSTPASKLGEDIAKLRDSCDQCVRDASEGTDGIAFERSRMSPQVPDKAYRVFYPGRGPTPVTESQRNLNVMMGIATWDGSMTPLFQITPANSARLSCLSDPACRMQRHNM